LFPMPLLPWVSTYKSPAGRDEELPQFSRNKLRAHMPASTTITFIFFDIYSPETNRVIGLSGSQAIEGQRL
jgi:hypothetical protein